MAAAAAAAAGAGVVPVAAKQAAVDEFERVGKNTFVEATLRNIAGALGSDAPFGYNPANKIRKRVEDVALELKQKPNETSAGRSVLEARFAMGYDDSQYLAQSVVALWAGDGGERLRLVHPSAIPAVIRAASARGVVNAMSKAIEVRRREQRTKLLDVLDMAAWVLCVPEIREAVIIIMSASPFDNVKKTAKAIQHQYKSMGDDAGKAYVKKILDTYTDDINPDAGSSRHIAREIVEALYILTCPSSRPAVVVDRLERETDAMVKRTNRDCTALLDLMSQMKITRHAQRGLTVTAATAQETQADLERKFQGADATNELCPKFDLQGDRIRATEPPHFRKFATSVAEAGLRMRAETASALKHNASGSDPPSPTNTYDTSQLRRVNQFVPPDRYHWKLSNSISPLTMPPTGTAFDAPSNDPLDDIEKAKLSEDMKAALADNNRGRVDDCTAELMHREINPGRRVHHFEITAFCMLRGVCGYIGPHQQLLDPPPGPGAAENPLVYNYPPGSMKRYSPGSIVAHSVRDVVPSSLRYEVCARGDVIFEDPTRRQYSLDTDYVGNVLDNYFPSHRDDGSAVENAMPAMWAPVNAMANTEAERMDYSEETHALCEAAMYEFMAASLRKPRSEDDATTHNLNTAAAAVAKLRQLAPMTKVRNTNYTSLEAGGLLANTDYVSKNPVYVTRPCINCSADDEPKRMDKLLTPVDGGLAVFQADPNRKTRPLAINRAAVIANKDTQPGANTHFSYPLDDSTTGLALDDGDRAVTNAALTTWLRDGMEIGWRLRPNDRGIVYGSGRNNWSMFMDTNATNDPVSAADKPATQFVTRSNNMNPADVTMTSMHAFFGYGLVAADDLNQIDCEEAYILKLSTDGSVQQQNIFGIGRSIEDTARDRRADIWSDAMREIAVSGDRLYRFVTELTGSIGESADSAILQEDDDLRQYAKESSKRQVALADRTARFHTKLIESVMSSTLGQSKLQLDLHNANGLQNELVVMSSEVKDNVRAIASGEGGHGFFEASVELNDLLNRSSAPIQIAEVVRRLSSVSREFHNQLAESQLGAAGTSTSASYARLAEPRNSLMLHLKPDTAAAIQKAFDHITAELRGCPGWHRHVHLWEFLEGKDWTMSTRFAELVGLMLQNTRMRSGSFAAYVGAQQLVANGHNIRMQLQRLLHQACLYLAMVPNPPNFLSENGRNNYFGGLKRPIQGDLEEEERLTMRKRQEVDGPLFRADPGDDMDDDDDNDDSRAETFRLRYRPDAVRRILYIANLKERQIQKAYREQTEMPDRVQPDFARLVGHLLDPTGNSIGGGIINGDWFYTLMEKTRSLVPNTAEGRQVFEQAMLSVHQILATEKGAEKHAVCGGHGWDTHGYEFVYKICDKLSLPRGKFDRDPEEYRLLELPTIHNEYKDNVRWRLLPSRNQYQIEIDLTDIFPEFVKANPEWWHKNAVLRRKINRAFNMLFLLPIDGKDMSWFPHYTWQNDLAAVGKKNTNVRRHVWCRWVHPISDRLSKNVGITALHVARGAAMRVDANRSILMGLLLAFGIYGGVAYGPAAAGAAGRAFTNAGNAASSVKTAAYQGVAGPLSSAGQAASNVVTGIGKLKDASLNMMASYTLDANQLEVGFNKLLVKWGLEPEDWDGDTKIETSLGKGDGKGDGKPGVSDAAEFLKPKSLLKGLTASRNKATCVELDAQFDSVALARESVKQTLALTVKKLAKKEKSIEGVTDQDVAEKQRIESELAQLDKVFALLKEKIEAAKRAAEESQAAAKADPAGSEGRQPPKDGDPGKQSQAAAKADPAGSGPASVSPAATPPPSGMSGVDGVGRPSAASLEASEAVNIKMMDAMGVVFRKEFSVADNVEIDRAMEELGNQKVSSFPLRDAKYAEFERSFEWAPEDYAMTWRDLYYKYNARAQADNQAYAEGRVDEIQYIIPVEDIPKAEDYSLLQGRWFGEHHGEETYRVNWLRWSYASKMVAALDHAKMKEESPLAAKFFSMIYVQAQTDVNIAAAWDQLSGEAKLGFQKKGSKAIKGLVDAAAELRKTAKDRAESLYDVLTRYPERRHAVKTIVKEVFGYPVDEEPTEDEIKKVVNQIDEGTPEMAYEFTLNMFSAWSRSAHREAFMKRYKADLDLQIALQESKLPPIGETDETDADPVPPLDPVTPAS